ncbi:alpha/beta-hydrolase [Colletotrichum caudatum]|nr:alpha/beta-hydrolase [Colletotrichum caudatum]
MYILEPTSPHTHTMILLHGRDSQAEEFASEFFESEAGEATVPPGTDRTLPAIFPGIRWVFPEAQELLSERFNLPMRQWFDMWSVEKPEERSEIQDDGLRQSVEAIRALLAREEALVSRSHIFLGGISQGFATAASTFLADGEGGFTGLIGFCSWLPLSCRARGSEYRHSLLSTPIILQHCRDDTVVPIDNGRCMRDILGQIGLEKVAWHEYEDGGHWINEPQGVDQLVEFVAQRQGCTIEHLNNSTAAEPTTPNRSSHTNTPE